MNLQAMSAYGYEIVQTLIVDIEPDEHVKRAMNEINAGELSIKNIQLYCSVDGVLSKDFSKMLDKQVRVLRSVFLFLWVIELLQLQGWG